jgi:hypothetical protein
MTTECIDESLEHSAVTTTCTMQIVTLGNRQSFVNWERNKKADRSGQP